MSFMDISLFSKNRVSSFITPKILPKVKRLKIDKMIKGPIHGTGDVYLGAFTGAYLNNKTFEEANLIAAKYTYKSILLSRKICSDKNGGLPFEVNMKQYLNKIK